MSTPGFMLGPTLLGKVRSTIARVEGEPIGSGKWTIPTRFEGDEGGGGGKVFRICTFTGAWSISASKTVTFKYQTNSPNTASAVNLFFDIPDDGIKNCAIAKDGTAWHLIQWQWAIATCSTATAAP